MKKVLLLALMILLCTGFRPVYAAAAPADASFSGSGTAEDPFLIETAADLQTLAVNVNYGTDYDGQYFLQTQNLDLEGINWTPIGLFQIKTSFAGIYDGGGHLIQNLTIGDDFKDPALFGILGGTVMNLGVVGGSINSTSCAAVFAGHASKTSARVLNCYSKGMEIISNRAGGIVDDFAGSVLNCWSDDLIANIGRPTSTQGGIFSYRVGQQEHCFTTVETTGFAAEDILKQPRILTSGEINSQPFVDLLNSWVHLYSEDAGTLGRELMLWRYSRGEIEFSTESVSNSLLQDSQPLETEADEPGQWRMILTALSRNMNPILITLTVFIGALVGCVFLGMESRRRSLPAARRLYATGITVIVLAACLWALVPLARGNLSISATGGIVERALLCVKLLILMFSAVMSACNWDRFRVRHGGWKTHVYLILTAGAFLWTALFAVSTWNSEAPLVLLRHPNETLFQGFFRTLSDALSHPAGLSVQTGAWNGTPHMPLTYLILKFFRFMIADISMVESPTVLQYVRGGEESLLLYVVFSVVLLFVMVFSTKKGHPAQRAATAFFLSLSGAFLFTLEEGSMFTLAMAGLFVYCFFRDSNWRILRIFSLLAMAAAAALEPYLIVFFLPLLLERKFTRFYQGMTYSIALWTASFLLFGGRELLSALWKERLGAAGVRGIDFASGYTALGTIATEQANFSPADAILCVVMALLLLLVAFRCRDWRQTLSLSLLVCGLARTSVPDTLLCLAPSMVMFLNDEEKQNGRRIFDGFYLFLFVCLFGLFPTRYVYSVGGLKLWSSGAAGNEVLTELVMQCGLIALSLTLIVETFLRSGRRTARVRKEEPAETVDLAEDMEEASAPEKNTEEGLVPVYNGMFELSEDSKNASVLVTSELINWWISDDDEEE